MAHQNHGYEELEYRYYAEKEVILHVQHGDNWFGGAGAEITTETLLDSLNLLYRSKEGGLGIFPQAVVSKNVVASRFVLPEEPGNTNHLTLVLLRWDDDLSVAQFVNNLNIYFKQSDEPLELIDESGERGQLKPALLNWFMGASTHIGIGSHGPGKRPRPIINSARIDEQDIVFKDESATFRSQLVTDKSKGCDNQVDVYILDTLPPLKRLEDAWKAWGKTTLKRFENIFVPLTKGPRGEYQTNQADYYYAGENDFAETTVTLEDDDTHALVLRNCYKDADYNEDPDHVDKPEYHHDYDSSDHGLFIAGIVHQIAPEADIHVIQVLNDRGISTFWNLTNGFNKVVALHKAPREAIINCSFTLSLPNLDDDECVNSIKIGLNEFDVRILLAELIKSCLDLITAIQKCVQGGALIVAASGNDSKANARKPARSLANTGFAVGVGALNKAGNIASYSNEADQPQSKGFMVFGGDYAEDVQIDPATKDYTDSGDGVIGIFTLSGIFEVNSTTSVPNHHGYAEWAGTSFAAPILSGAIAKLLFAKACNGQSVSPDGAIELVKTHSKQKANSEGQAEGQQPDKPWTFKVEQKRKTEQELPADK